MPAMAAWAGRPDSNLPCVPVDFGGDACPLAKMTRQVALAGKAHLVGNSGDGQLGGRQQVLGLDDPACNHILMRRLPGGLLEEAGKVIRTHPGCVCHGGEG